MKIAIDCRFWGEKNTGLGRYTKNLVENLLQIDKKNHYILLLHKKDIQNINHQSLAINHQAVDIPHYSLKEQLLLPFILNKLKPDLVHFPHFNVPVGFNKPYVLTIHDLIKHESRGFETTTKHPVIYFIKYFGYKWVIAKAINRAKNIVTPSDWIKKQILKYYDLPQDRITVTYEGIDKNYQQPASSRQLPETNLNKYKIKKPFIIYTGNAYPHKNLRRLILATKMVNLILNQQKKPLLNLVIVCGRDIFWQRLKQEIAELKAEPFVNLTGFIKDEELRVIYSQAKFFITASLMEGFGLPALEAMSSHCPVLCSHIPVFKEVYGNASVYFDPENIDDIKDKILTMLMLPVDDIKKIINLGIKQIKKYSWQTCAQKTLKLYENSFSI